MPNVPGAAVWWLFIIVKLYLSFSVVMFYIVEHGWPAMFLLPSVFL